ncbi:phosphatidate cytidylyltransferase [Conservatibacter flavescens]|uniref:Phosphatidate cytidylyltransferase n=1 Tax=Conservatibacter flavescens TaxID=28161 RepID=A0A2M8S1E4_9PAST|nr:phosphatidate cytidylyltransferase [Conservatibacter flavescens]PJG84960.1 phosphatidate cytidylyltransferase [Conservatibacter flavescens]
MLKERVLSAIVLILIVFAALFFFPPFYFALAIAVVVSLGVWEWTQFPRFKLPIWRMVITGISGALLFLWIYGEADYLAVGKVFTDYAQPLLLSGVIWWMVALLLVIAYPKSTILWQNRALLHLIFAGFTLVPFFIGVLMLRLDHYISDPYQGIILLLYVFVLVWAADSGAYFAGRQWGKHKLAPKVSPGKTWEGVIGGLCTAALFAWLFLAFTSIEANIALPRFIGLSVATVGVSILGDLTESMFKREAGVKDSSQLIPGHGGVLDRIDSLTAAVPFFTYFYFFVL